MPSLSVAVCSIASTRRRRFLWAVWWTGAPVRAPFRKPDASNGGARTRQEALREAERAAGRPLVEIDGSFARAWGRMLVGQPPWNGRRSAAETSTRPAASATRPSAWAVLGVDPKASIEEIKRAFRKRALETHPDRGGDAEAFRAAKRAYEHALVLRSKKARSKREQSG